jgi:WD40 repeat protein
VKAAALGLLLLASPDAGEGARGLDPASCGLLRTIAPLGGELYGASFSPDGRRVAVGCQQGVRIFDTATGREAGRLEGHPQHVYSTAFSRDGRWVAAGGFEGAVQVWDAAGKPSRTLNGHTTFVAALAFSPDGRWLLAGALDGSLRAWELTEGGRSHELPARAGGVTDAAFTDDRALTTGVDGRVHVWKTDPWELERSVDLRLGGEARWFAFSPGARRVAGLTSTGLASAEPLSGRSPRTLSPVEGTLCRPLSDGRHAVVALGGPGRLRILDLARGKTAAELVHHVGEITSIAIHPSDRMIATTGTDRHLKLWGRVPGGMARVRPRGFLGVRIQQDAAGTVLLAEVIAGTAAEKAGLQAGDVVRLIGGKSVGTPTEATDQIGSFLEGDEVDLVLERAGQEKPLRVRLGRRPSTVEQ